MHELEAGIAPERCIKLGVVGPPVGLLAIRASSPQGGRGPTEQERQNSEEGRDAGKSIGELERERERAAERQRNQQT